MALGIIGCVLVLIAHAVQAIEYNQQQQQYQEQYHYGADTYNQEYRYQQQNAQQPQSQFQQQQQIQPIHLDNVKQLSFRKNILTATIRNQPFPQLSMLPCPASSKVDLDVVHCTNTGWNGEQYVWKCTAEMAEEWEFDAIRVVCEGWSGPGDHWITPDSCSLEYTLKQVIPVKDSKPQPQVKASPVNAQNIHSDEHIKSTVRDSWDIRPDRRAIDLKDVHHLQFHWNKQTKSRWGESHPQIVFLGGKGENGRTVFETEFPNIIECSNKGYGSHNGVVWKCKAELPEDIEFDDLEVICEGWRGPGDRWIVPDSCSLRFSIKPVAVHGEQALFEGAGIIIIIVAIMVTRSIILLVQKRRQDKEEKKEEEQKKNDEERDTHVVEGYATTYTR